MRRIVVVIAVLLLALPVVAVAQDRTLPPAGAVVLAVGYSDGAAILPVGTCVLAPGGKP